MIANENDLILKILYFTEFYFYSTLDSSKTERVNFCIQTVKSSKNKRILI